MAIGKCALVLWLWIYRQARASQVGDYICLD